MPAQMKKVSRDQYAAITRKAAHKHLRDVHSINQSMMEYSDPETRELISRAVYRKAPSGGIVRITYYVNPNYLTEE